MQATIDQVDDIATGFDGVQHFVVATVWEVGGTIYCNALGTSHETFEFVRFGRRRGVNGWYTITHWRKQ